MSDAQVLLQPWTGPCGGAPPLDRIDVDALAPALEAAIAERAEEAAAIREDPSAPTFENTFVALERMGSTLERVHSMYHLWCDNFSTPAVREVAQEMEPRLTAARDAIYQDRALFDRLMATPTDGLSTEQERLRDVWLRKFRRAGAHLDTPQRERIASINRRLSTLHTTFGDRLLADEEGWVTWLTADQLGGLSDGWLDAAKSAAEELGKPDLWAVTNTRSSVEPFLEASTERDLRKTVWERFYSRGDNGDENATSDLVTEILQLRLEKARILGFDTHAHLVLESTMAKTPDAAMELMRRVWEPAAAAFRAQVQELQALADRRGDDLVIEPWDVRFYNEILRRERYDFDPDVLLPHFQLDALVEGMFWAATERFGWAFTELQDVPLPHPDWRVWRVDNEDGSPRGLFYLDPYARKGKRSGAWMTAYRVQQGLGGHLPVVSNNCNFTRPPNGKPCLLSLDNARTLFHEFGHALHGLASEVTYPSLAGTSVARDYVEFPSQLNEHWLETPELLSRFARHQTTGEPPSAAVLERMQAASNADQPFRTMEFMASAVMDMEMHLETEPVDAAAFEAETLTRWGLPHGVVMRHRTPHFMHVFAGGGYAAGYYSYLWADVLVADAAEAFAETGFYDAPLSKSLYDRVLARGNTVDPAESYRAFRGRDADVDALLRGRGLVA
jgi:peptidyl-dipeptidase Dcp